MSMKKTPVEEAEFLMERLLDAQEEVAKLQEEVAKWKSMALLRSAADDASAASIQQLLAADSEGSMKPAGLKNEQILLALRDSLASSLAQINRDIQRSQVISARVDEAGEQRLGSSHTAADAAADLSSCLFPKLRNELLRFRSVAELERLYRVGIRIGFDAPRILRLALEKLSQLTNKWALLQVAHGEEIDMDGGGSSQQQAGVGAVKLPSYCYSKEWSLPFRKALTEVVIALEMHSSSATVSPSPARPSWLVETWHHLKMIVLYEDALISLSRQMHDKDADELREQRKTAFGCNVSTKKTSSAVAANGGPTVTPRSRSSSPRGPPQPQTLQSIQLPGKQTSIPQPATGSQRGTAVAKQAGSRSPQGNASLQTTVVPSSLPPRAPLSSLQLSCTPGGHRSASVDCMPASSGKKPADVRTPSSSISYDPNHTTSTPLVNARGTAPIGRSTPATAIDVPRRVVLKSPSPKANRPVVPQTIHSASKTLVVSSSSSPPRSALKCPSTLVAPKHTLVDNEGSVFRHEEEDDGVSPRSSSGTPPWRPHVQHYDVQARELSAEQPMRRREPQPTHVAPETTAPATLPSPGGRQVRFSDA